MIVLVNPRSAQWKHRLPLSVLSLVPGLEPDYPCSIVDLNFESDPEDAVRREIEKTNARILAVTVMPGPQLQQAIPLCRNLKRLFPGLAIVWGGYFASLHAKAVVRSGFVDFVIRGPGEHSFRDLVQSLVTGKPLDDIPGLVCREDGAIRENPKRAMPDANALPPVPYSKVDVRRYIGPTVLGTRTISMHTSFGCPFTCGFCAVAEVYRGRWSGRKASSVVDEALWLRDVHGVNAIEFVDNNFFVAEARTAEIAAGLDGKNVAWWGEGRPDTVMSFSDGTLELMRRSGCRMIFFGAESSSADVLALMDKGGTQTPDTVIELAARFGRVGIVPEFSFVLGTPGDDVDAQTSRDIEYIRRVKAVNPQSEIIIYVYSPVFYDDAALLEEARRHGFRFPEQLEDWLKPEWSAFDLRRNPGTPWLSSRQVERIRNFERVLNARYPTVSDIRLQRWQTGVLRTLGSWRYRFGVYAAPWEIRLVANRWFKYRQPETEGF